MRELEMPVGDLRIFGFRQDRDFDNAPIAAGATAESTQIRREHEPATILAAQEFIAGLPELVVVARFLHVRAP